MDLNQLDKLQDQLLGSMKADDDEELEIIETAELIANELTNKQYSSIRFNDMIMKINYEVKGRIVKLYAVTSSSEKLFLTGGMKRYTANVEHVESRTLSDTLRYGSEALLRHITGRIRPEMIED